MRLIKTLLALALISTWSGSAVAQSQQPVPWNYTFDANGIPQAVYPGNATIGANGQNGNETIGGSLTVQGNENVQGNTQTSGTTSNSGSTVNGNQVVTGTVVLGVQPEQYTYNLNASTMPNLTAALAKAVVGSADANIYFVGGSTTQGAFGQSSGSPNCTNAFLFSYVAVAAHILQGAGYPVNYNSQWADQNVAGCGTGGTVPAANPQIAFGSGWAPTVNAGNVIGGSPLYNNSTATPNYLGYTPITPIDNCDIYYIQGGSSGSFSWQFDGGSPTTINANGSSANIKVNVTTTLGYHTLNIARVSSNIWINALHCGNSTAKAINFHNVARGGGGTTFWTDNSHTYSPGTIGLAPTNPDACFIETGVNDWPTGESQATYLLQLTAEANQCKRSGDVAFIVSTPSAASITPLATQAAFVATIYQVAAALNAPVIDFTNLVGSYATPNITGCYSTDVYHATQACYSVQGSLVARSILDLGISAPTPPTSAPVSKATAILAGGTKFTISGCSASATLGGATAGQFTSGTTGTCTVVITMNGATGLAAPNGWNCEASDLTTPADLIHQTTPSSATQCTLSGTTVSGDAITFQAQGY